MDEGGFNNLSLELYLCDGRMKAGKEIGLINRPYRLLVVDIDGTLQGRERASDWLTTVEARSPITAMLVLRRCRQSILAGRSLPAGSRGAVLPARDRGRR